MSKYLLTLSSKEMTVRVDLQYNNKERLTGWWVLDEIPEKTLDWLIHRIPIYRDKLSIFTPIKEAKIYEYPEDLTFKRFWDEYNLKHSNKKQTEKAWEAMTDVDKKMAFIYLREYENYLLTNPGVSKMHGATYLNQRRWDN